MLYKSLVTDQLLPGRAQQAPSSPTPTSCRRSLRSLHPEPEKFLLSFVRGKVTIETMIRKTTTTKTRTMTATTSTTAKMTTKTTDNNNKDNHNKDNHNKDSNNKDNNNKDNNNKDNTGVTKIHL